MSVRIRLTAPTVGYLGKPDGNPKLVTIPEGSILTIPTRSTDEGAHQIEVYWNDTVVTVFAADLRDRGTVLAPAAKVYHA